MSRGSFKYKEKLEWRARCSVVSVTEDEDGKRITLKDEKKNTEYEVWVRKKGTAAETVMKRVDELPVPVNRFWVTYDTSAAEHIYGCGETYSEFDLKGQKVRIWVAEHQNLARISKKLIREKLTGRHPKRKQKFDQYESYYVQPTFTSSDKYFVHADIQTYAEFDFRKPGKTTIYTQELPHIICDRADTFPELSEKVSALLGHQRKLPDWIYEGGILAMQDWVPADKAVKEGFNGCGNIDRKLAELDEAGARTVGVWCQDWCGCRCTGFGYQVMWNWKYSEEQYPELPKKIMEWKERGVRFLGYINPFLALEKDLYREASEKGFCVKNKAGEDYLVTITTFPAAMVDFTNPVAYDWYKNQIKENMIGIGMGGWMADFGEYLPVDAVLYDGEAALLHNQWPAIWARMNREAIEECHAEDEVFFFTRAGYTETIRHSAMMWTGDQHVDWSVDDGMPSVIPATLSLGMSGYGITHSDIGGYTTVMHMRRSKELLMRWAEMNVFSPLYRSHEGNQPGNDVQFNADREILEHVARCTRLHGQLSEYTKALVQEAVQAGIPVMRPVFYHYDEEWAYTEQTEYLFGRDMLVAPVLEEGVTDRTVHLPKDAWVHLFTGKEYSGGVCKIPAPMGMPPVFVRKNSDKFEMLMGLSKQQG